jgi:hypothetical protein
MKVKASASSLSTVAPYVLSATLILSPSHQTITSTPSPADTAFYRAYEQAYVFRPAGPAIPVTSGYYLAIDRPDLMPTAIIGSVSADIFEFYEPFIISEGWREEASIVGPFLVEEDHSPIVTFDAYDRAAIGLYE